MPDEQNPMDQENNQTNQNTQETPPTDNPSVSREELDKILEQSKQQQARIDELMQHNQQMANMMNQTIQQQQHQQTPQQTTPQVTYEEAMRAINDDGDYSKMMQYNEQQNQKTKQELLSQIDEIKKYGAQAIGSLSISQARNDPNMPHFKKYEKEIMDAVNRTGSSDSETVKNCYDWVVGRHSNEIIQEELEKLQRQKADETKNSSSMPRNQQKSPGDRFAKQNENEEVSPDEYFSTDAQRLLALKGFKDYDTYAQKMGFRDFKTMTKEAPRSQMYDQTDEEYEYMLKTGHKMPKQGA